jgi:hypothetical protein
MNTISFSDARGNRRGLSMAEMIVTIAVTSVAMIGGMQMIALSGRQFRAIEDRRLAGLEAGNLMEQVMLRPWEELTAEQLASLELSEACRQALPDVQLRISVDAGDAVPAAKRITIEIGWRVNAAHRGAPVRLVAWRFGEVEVQS